jgi:hypothetical protein
MIHMSNFRKKDPYLDFENDHTEESSRLFYAEKDPIKREAYRQLTLKIRIASRDCWLAMGKKLPPEVRWEEPYEQGRVVTG